jgi:hypothetical protein
LQSVIRRQVLPKLRERHRVRWLETERQALDRASDQLVAVLLKPETSLDAVCARVASIARPLAWTSGGWVGLFERAASMLGDRWLDEEIGETDLTLALMTLQTAVHEIENAQDPVLEAMPEMRSVLVAPLPGEPHLLEASLHREALWRAGWRVDCDWPSNDSALERLVTDQWFDVIDLTLSCALPHEHLLQRMGRTIAALRRCSRNPRLAIVVGGRLFAERTDDWHRVKADAGCGSAMSICRASQDALAHAGVDQREALVRRQAS